MRAGDVFGEVAAWSARHARFVLAVTVVVALAATFSATRLPIDSGTDTLVGPGSDAALATEQVRESFGEDPIVVLVEGELLQTLRPPDIFRIMNLEACLAGNVPDGAEALPGPCEELAELRPAQLVSGPATFLNQAAAGLAGELSRRLDVTRERANRVAERAEREALAAGSSRAEAEAAGEDAGGAVVREFVEGLVGMATRFGFAGIPSLGDPSFVSAVVFDPEAEPPGKPKERLAYLFPDRDATQIIVRLRSDLSDSERSRAIDLIRAAVAYTEPHERCAFEPGGEPEPCFALTGGEYTVSGAPVVVDSLTRTLRHALAILFAIAVLVMAGTLVVVFRSPARLLPLALALGAAAIAFGAKGLAGGGLNLASIAVLPILIGLAVDYTIQLQARFDEVIASGLEGEDAAREAGRLGAPIISTACLATTAGFATLALSPTPMVRDFGLLLAVGVLAALVLALVAGSAALSLRPAPTARSRGSGRVRAIADALAAARDRMAEVASEIASGSLRVATVAPGRVLAIGLLVAVIGWAAGTRADTVSEITELVPQGLTEVRDLNALQEATGASGELDVIVTSPDITDPEVVAWMASLKRRVLERGGYDPENPDCRAAEICPGPSLTDFIAGVEAGVTRERIDDLIAALPDQELQALLEIDPETGEIGDSANLAFMIGLMPLERQHQLIEGIEAEIAREGEAPPEGTTAQVGGLPAIAAETARDMSNSRYWLALASILAVSLILLAVFRSPLRVAVTVAPILLATGWSSAMLGAMSVPLNPISAILGVLVVAIGTEFSVILSSRYRQQRLLGDSIEVALRRTYARSGAAVLASGLTVIAGFAVLLASEVRMLRDFGLVTVVDLGVALAGVLLVLPAAIVLGERFESRSRARAGSKAASPAAAGGGVSGGG